MDDRDNIRIGFQYVHIAYFLPNGKVVYESVPRMIKKQNDKKIY